MTDGLLIVRSLEMRLSESKEGQEMSQVQKREKDWIEIIQPDNEKRIASPEYVKNLLGVNEDKKELQKQVYSLQNRMRTLATIFEKQITEYLTPEYERKFLFLLSQEKKSVHPWGLLNQITDEEGFHIPYGTFLDKLVKEEKIIVKRGWYKLAPKKAEVYTESEKK
jgi:hypothetical protein